MAGARICAKCGSRFPRWAWVDGKQRNLQRRRYCLSCSPFGEHNTRVPSAPRRAERADLVCVQCGRTINAKQHKGVLCWTCAYGRRATRRYELVYQLVGDSCWRCGYSRGKAGRRVLDFHHVSRKEKSFGLDARRIVNLAWDRVKCEILTCVLLCAICHREVESGLIPLAEIQQLHSGRWALLKAAIQAVSG